MNINFTKVWAEGSTDKNLTLAVTNLENIGELKNTTDKLSFMDDGKIVRCANSLYRSVRGYLPSFLPQITENYSNDISNLHAFKVFLDEYAENPVLNPEINAKIVKALANAKIGLESLFGLYIIENKKLNIDVTDSLLSNIEYYQQQINQNPGYPSLNKKIEQLFEKIIQSENNEELKFYESQTNHRVFSLKSMPNKIYKVSLSNNKNIEERYEKMLSARVLCRIKNLFNLVVPEARKFEVEYKGKKYTVIEEEKLDIESPEIQEELYKKVSDQTVRELITFIAETGFSDVEYRNIPIINGTDKVGLIDLEEYLSAKVGIIGGYANGGKRRGLLNCVNKEQISIITEEFRKIFPEDSCDGAVASRIKELEDEDDLNNYYEDNEIKTLDQQVLFDRNDFSFESYPCEDQELLYCIAENLVNEINRKISIQNSLTFKKRREVTIDLSPKSIFYGEKSRRPDNKKMRDFSDEKDYYKGCYLNIVIDQLIENGLIFKKKQETPSYLVLQA